LIVITVSDFLADGAAEVEARAKGIFQILCDQSDTVILMDEMDQLLLDRDSKQYKLQTGIFQFITNGMLTKLQDLGDAKGTVFFLATNYFERIDSAIRRRGRIDEAYLLSVPDWQQRVVFLKRFLFGKEMIKNDTTRAARQSAVAAEITKSNDLKKATAHFAFGDLKYLAKQFERSCVISGDEYQRAGGAKLTDPEIASELAHVATTVRIPISLASYQGRLQKENGAATGTSPARENSEIIDEFLVLLYLMAEAERELTTAEVEATKEAMRIVGSVNDESWFTNLKDSLAKRIDDSQYVDTLVNWLNKQKAKF
jgi:hypothetical protein